MKLTVISTMWKVSEPTKADLRSGGVSQEIELLNDMYKAESLVLFKHIPRRFNEIPRSLNNNVIDGISTAYRMFRLVFSKQLLHMLRDRYRCFVAHGRAYFVW